MIYARLLSCDKNESHIVKDINGEMQVEYTYNQYGNTAPAALMRLSDGPTATGDDWRLYYVVRGGWGSVRPDTGAARYALASCLNS